MKIDFNDRRVQFACVVILGLVIWGIVAAVNTSKHKTIEQYIKDAQSALTALTASNVSFVNYAKDYVSKRTGSETSVNALVVKSSDALKTITDLRNDCQSKSTSISQSLTALTSINGTASVLASSSATAVDNIKAIIEETRALETTSATTFGSNLEAINTNKNNAETNYTNISGFIGTVEKNYNDATTNQSLIAGHLSTAYSALYDLQAFIRDLVNNIRNSIEYINLQNAKTKADTMISQLEVIERNMTTKSGLQYSQITSLLTSLRTASASAGTYLTNVISVFNLATQGADSILSGYVSAILNNFTKAVALLGSLNYMTPSPFINQFVFPTLGPTEGSTIVSLWNKSHEDYKNLVTQYNRFIGYFNDVTRSLNSLTDYGGSNIVGGVNTNINSLNTSLLSAQKEMAAYFPGGTTPGVIPYTGPAVPGALSLLPTVAPYTYTAIV